MVNLKRKDLVTLILLPILAFIITVSLNPGYFAATFLFYFLPSLYLGLQNKNESFLKIVALSSFLSFPFLIVIDYIGTISRIWMVPAPSFSSWMILGIIPLDDMVWMITATIYILTLFIYSHKKDQTSIISSRNILLFAVIEFVVLCLFLWVRQSYADLLVWETEYAYMILGSVVLLIPGIILSLFHKGLLAKELQIVPFFLYTTILFELVATARHYWIFTGSYIVAPLQLGNFGPLPFEELFFVGVAGPIAAIVLYEWVRK
jgi:hypothetical protein